MPRPSDGGGGGGRIRRPPINRARQMLGNHPAIRNARARAFAVAPGEGGGGGGGTPPGPNPYDYSMDPLLQRIRAAGTARIGEGEAEALRARKQLLIDYGDPDLARSLGLDETTIAAAGQNPFSIRSRLNREAVERPKALTESLSAAGGMYSSHFGKEHSDLSRSLLEDQSRASGAAREGLSGIENTLLGLRREVDQENMEAEEAAAERLRERLGDLPVGGAGAGGGGGGGGRAQGVGMHVPGERLAMNLRPGGPRGVRPRGGQRPPRPGQQGNQQHRRDSGRRPRFEV